VRFILDILGQNVETIDVGGEPWSQRPLAGSFHSETSRAAPAVSPALNAERRISWMILRHCPNALHMAVDILQPRQVAPSGAIS